jgi:hypothetical protein
MNIRAKIFGGQTADEPILKAKTPKGAKADALGSIAVRREESRKSNSRRDDRHRLSDELVRLCHDNTSYEVELINLSGGGAMVRGDLDPKLWDMVRLELGDGATIECAVRWIRDDRFGLEFAHETRIDCGADEQAALLREVVRRTFPDLETDVPSEAVPSQDGPDARDDRRHPLVWSGVLHHDYQSTPVRLRNISAAGVMIECANPLRLGSEPLLELSDALSLSATVTWGVGDHAGLRFHSPFDLHQLAQTKPAVAAAEWQPPSYLECRSVTDSPWAEQWDRLSVGELRQQLEGFLKR